MIFEESKDVATVRGNKLKKEPQPTPLTIAKKSSSSKLSTKGQIHRPLTPQRKREMIMLFIGPRIKSAEQPAKTRPKVEAKFQTVSAMRAVDLELLTDRAKTGMKYGGTNNGKQAIAPPRRRTMNLGSLRRYLGTARQRFHSCIRRISSDSGTVPLQLRDRGL